MDILGVFFFVLLAIVGVGAGYAALEFGWFRSAWEICGWLLAVAAFIAAGVGIQSRRAPANANVHGTAKAASEAEAQAAARGDMKSASLHDQTFPN